MPKGEFVAKKDILEIEKRVVDLELAVNELKEGFKGLDLNAISELKQRLEDVEDLVMVENAGIIELKKMLEEATKVPPTPAPEITLPPNLEERLVSLEEKIKSIRIPEIPSLQPLEERIMASIETTRSDLYSKISDMEKRFVDFEGRLSSIPDFEKLKTETKNAVLSSLPDFKKVESKLMESIESFKTDIDMKKHAIEKIAAGIEEQLKMPLPERAVEELKRIRNDWLVNNARVDAVEKFAQDFAKEINAIRPTVKKLETFEKIIDLKKDVDERLQEFKSLREDVEKEFKIVREQAQKLAEKNEALLKEMEKSAKSAEEKLKDLSHITTAISRLSKDSENIKEQISKLAKIDEVKPIARGLDLMMSDYKSLVEDMSKRIVELQTNVNNNLKEIESRSLIEVEKITKSLNERFGMIEKRLDEVSKKSTIGARAEVQPLREIVEKLSKDLEKSKIDVSSMVRKNEISPLIQKLEMLENRMKELQIDELKKLLDSTNLRISQLEEKLKEMVETKAMTTREMKELQLPQQSFLDQQINELLSRIVFLESRLVAVESMMQETSRSLPIVIE